MPLTFLHTADWQIGKPFGSIADSDKRARLQHHRIQSLERIADLVREHDAAAVLVAGDLFDSPSPTKSTVSAMFGAIGKMAVPVIAIPGNHDFGGPGGPWQQDFVKQEAAQLAPNFQILTSTEPLVLDSLVILPAPLMERMERDDPTSWIRHAFEERDLPSDRPRVVLAHGSVQGFSSSGEEGVSAESNILNLDRLPSDELDYLALGDWHGTKQVGPKAWYAGTPEIDRFPKGEQNEPGHVMKVTVNRGALPEVEPLSTTAIQWHRLTHRFDLESGIDELQSAFEAIVGTGAEGALLHLELSGQLGIEDAIKLQNILETWEARLIRLKLRNRVVEAPSDEEIQQLTQRADDPLIARVASRLLDQADGDPNEAASARLALRELYQATLF